MYILLSLVISIATTTRDLIMERLYEYIDPISQPYEAFRFDSEKSPLPIPAHWHYYVELIYVIESSIDVTFSEKKISASEGSVILFPPKSVHSISHSEGCSIAKYDVV